ncbi:helix-turn-helix domain-containing protein [Lichenihabitans sp. Uapishka_5]|uniref:helix-turn-helix domain-containing protein n=1 Tax=Lichenihabitans sp. Uapishka_5 TaxID=3037302 RepID=UPI0029E81BE8|nr:helix-turn-helix domain-containing protein [Lichenihabitans sp. Uapishka_5]MDX7953338.1 helix-turn-helix domain-containing protein [Lichenihabitans sp. Uapishka_5]
MQPVQVKMARAALGLTLEQLAQQAGVDGVAIQTFEAGGTVEGAVTSALNLFLATHGIELIEGDGVRARASSAKDYVPINQVTTDTDGGIS